MLYAWRIKGSESGSKLCHEQAWIFWEQCPPTINSSFDLWTVKAIENLEQCIKERREAVIINHKMTTALNTHTHSNWCHSGWKVRLGGNFSGKIYSLQSETIKEPDWKQISLIYTPLNLKSAKMHAEKENNHKPKVLNPDTTACAISLTLRLNIKVKYGFGSLWEPGEAELCSGSPALTSRITEVTVHII